jgi:hypothetical protein
MNNSHRVFVLGKKSNQICNTHAMFNQNLIGSEPVLPIVCSTRRCSPPSQGQGRFPPATTSVSSALPSTRAPFSAPLPANQSLHLLHVQVIPRTSPPRSLRTTATSPPSDPPSLPRLFVLADSYTRGSSCPDSASTRPSPQGSSISTRPASMCPTRGACSTECPSGTCSCGMCSSGCTCGTGPTRRPLGCTA